MKKNKLQTAPKTDSNHQKQSLARSMTERTFSKSGLQNTRTHKVQDNGKHNLETSRTTNKENAGKRVQNVPLLAARSSYSSLHQQKRQYLSQSMIQINGSFDASKDVETNNDFTDGSLMVARNSLRQLLRAEGDGTKEDPHCKVDLSAVLDQVIYEAIISSQENKIIKLESQIQSLTVQLSQMDKLRQEVSCHQETISRLTKQQQANSSLVLKGDCPRQSIDPKKQAEFLNKQNQSLRKDVAAFRKEASLSKKEISTLKKCVQLRQAELSQAKIQVQALSQQLREKASWLHTLEYQNTLLTGESTLHGEASSVQEENSSLREYVFNLNKSYDLVVAKLRIIHRQHLLQVQESKRKHQTDIKRLRQKIRKPVKPIKKRNLRGNPDSDDSLDWDLEEEAN